MRPVPASWCLTSSLIDPRAKTIARRRAFTTIAPAAAIVAVLVAVFLMEVM